METTGIFTFRKIDEIAARQMVSWQYDAPYDTYSCAPGELEASVQWDLKPQYQYYTVWDENQELTGQRAFDDESLESIIGRILEAEPKPVTELKPVTPIYTVPGE